MTAPELCFLGAAIVFVLAAMPGFKSGIELVPAGLALLAFGLALQAGFASEIGLDGEIITLGFVGLPPN